MDKGKRVEEYFQATEPAREELAKWIEEEEERLQRDLTEKELEEKFEEFLAKYNVKKL